MVMEDVSYEESGTFFGCCDISDELDDLDAFFLRKRLDGMKNGMIPRGWKYLGVCWMAWALSGCVDFEMGERSSPLGFFSLWIWR